MDLHSFAVSLGPNDPVKLIASADGRAELKRWKFAHLNLHEDYAAALAVEGQTCDLRFFQEQAA